MNQQHTIFLVREINVALFPRLHNIASLAIILIQQSVFQHIPVFKTAHAPISCFFNNPASNLRCLPECMYFFSWKTDCYNRSDFTKGIHILNNGYYLINL